MAAIAEAQRSPRIRATAKAISAQFQREDGVARAVEIIERTLDAKAPLDAPTRSTAAPARP
ncbi:Hypothetical protein A7982_07697 [Minicystis rosea]|nr:Hypothetical protein A7982_07697 [Minicystis rosea]